jgi:CRP/FNR family transcriptional regulator, anaerobic regulatory protein
MSLDLSKHLLGLSPKLISLIETSSDIQEIPAHTEVLRQGQYVKVIPIVLEGLIRVFTKRDDKELLLYYIQPTESCIMSFSVGLKNEPSVVNAETEETTTVLLIPVDKVIAWTHEFPEINNLFFHLYNLRYSDLLQTIQHVLFDKMDKRLYDYLMEKVRVTGKNPIKISHRQIAGDLGTAREVVSRIMKKLETEGKVVQHTNSIEITGL